MKLFRVRPWGVHFVRVHRVNGTEYTAYFTVVVRARTSRGARAAARKTHRQFFSGEYTLQSIQAA